MRESLLRTQYTVARALRYVQLYGLSRTDEKIQAEVHSSYPAYRLLRVLTIRRRQSAKNPPDVAIIGCGKFAFGNIAYYLTKEFGGVIRSVMDVDPDKARSIARGYGIPLATSSVDEIVDDPKIGLVHIPLDHASHAEYAIRCLRAGKAVHIERLHAVSEAQLEELCEAIGATKGLLRTGFNRPLSPLTVELLDHLATEEGPITICWFVAGHEIPLDHWYFAPEEGGRVLGNLCHWTGYCLRLVQEAAGDREIPEPVSVKVESCAGSVGDLVASHVCSDGPLASISFSAKGHAFEGVREHMSVHRGSMMAELSDFSSPEIRQGFRRCRYKSRHRDHGHGRSICSSCSMAHRCPDLAHDRASVDQTGRLVAQTRDSFESASAAAEADG